MNNKRLLEEINRFRMMTYYEPGKVINEQSFGLINEQKYPGTNSITWMEPGGNQNDLQRSANDRTGYLGEVIGTITDDVLELNEIGNYIFDKRKYPKTVEQVELLETQGKVRISEQNFADYSKMSKEDGEKLKSKKVNQDKIPRKDIRRSKKMYRKMLELQIDSANWKRTNSGSMIMQSMYPAAYNCGPENGFLWIGTNYTFNVAKPEGPEYKPVYTGETSTGVTVNDFNIGESARVFPDNMVKPALTGDAKEEFDEIVNEFVAYINAGGFDKLTNVTIQGQADSANPTWEIPKGYSSLDHSYGGIKRKTSYTDDELDEMNLYLATQRAKNYKQLIIDAVEEKTGEVLNIKELPAISYRGQANKRGSKWRSILLKSNAPEFKPVFMDPVKEKEYQDYIKTKQEVQSKLASGMYPVSAEIGTPDGLVEIDKDENGVPYVLYKSEVSTQGTYTTEAIYLSTDAIEKFKIPEYPNRVINNVKLTDYGSLSLIDSNGNTQEFEFDRFSNADYVGNAVSLQHRKGDGRFTSYMGASDFNRGAGGTTNCPGDTGKYATMRPMTTVDDSNRAVRYGGKTYRPVINLWFALTLEECGFSYPEVDYYNVPEIGEVFN